MAFTGVPVDNLLFCGFIGSSDLLDALITEIHEVSGIGFTAAPHADVPCLTIGSSTTSVTHKACLLTFLRCLWLQICAKPLYVNIPVAYDKDGVFIDWVALEFVCSIFILLFSTVHTLVYA